MPRIVDGSDVGMVIVPTGSVRNQVAAGVASFTRDAVYYYAYSDLLLVTQNCMFIAADVSYG